ncbi:hypothetical protein IHE45_08G157000 [Dioscorea alata]|uniref:Uncharacterized protein n=1 Tax=Dioscorea alata TaxID=55571 RepID=A0ACB7VNW0_DIOAL|nr:hypothetical protein IHE45_08G157000 [Dioscorea alata]
MRILELVSCGGRMAAAVKDAPEEQVTVPINPMGCGSPEKRWRRSSNASGSSSWRPSLGSISEDGVAVKMAAAVRKGGEKTKRSGSRSTARASSRRERSDFGQYSVPPMMPAFTPTAFLF